MSDEMQNDRKYLTGKLNPILQPLISDLIKSRPSEVFPFIKNWVQTKGVRIQQELDLKRSYAKPVGVESSSEHEEDDEGDDVYAEEMAFQKKVQTNVQKPSRISVSAEVYGEFNKKEHFKPPVYPKSASEMENIMNKIDKSILFSALDHKEKTTVALAMRVVNVLQNTKVIEQGADGNELFVVNTGQLDCFKRFNDEDPEKYLLTYGPGGAFGELALLYNAPRAATIVAKEDCVLFSLDRTSFNNIVKEAVVRKREKFMAFVDRIHLFDLLSVQDKEKICDCLVLSTHHEGEKVIREGEKGDRFYLIQEGECHASKWDALSNQDKVVYHFKPNDYFGELALLKDAPRAATITADCELTLASFDRASFKRLFGPLEELLNKNADRYKQFLDQ